MLANSCRAPRFFCRFNSLFFFVLFYLLTKSCYFCTMKHLGTLRAAHAGLERSPVPERKKQVT